MRVYLPPDTNTLLSTVDHCLRSRNYVNVIVAGKQPQPSWLSMDEADLHCTRHRHLGLGEQRRRREPDVVMACAGDVPTLEILAAVSLLRTHLPDLKVRVVNVVDLMRLEPDTEHPHGLSDRDYDTLFTDRQAGDLRVPRVSVADPPAHLPPPRPRQPARARLQGRRNGDDAVRHGRAQRHGPVPSGDGRDRPGARSRHEGGDGAPAHGRRAHRHVEYTHEFGEDMPEVRDWMWPA